MIALLKAGADGGGGMMLKIGIVLTYILYRILRRKND
jgi:hypothetical protein